MTDRIIEIKAALEDGKIDLSMVAWLIKEVEDLREAYAGLWHEMTARNREVKT